MLRETSGDKLAAARLLGIGKTTLYRKLKLYHMEQPQADPPPKMDAATGG
jgi:two-component system response regulator HydG